MMANEHFRGYQAIRLVCLVAGFCLAGSLPASALTPEELQTLSQRHESAVKSGVLTYTVQNTRSSVGVIPADILERFPGLDKVAEANRVIQTRETLTFDAQRGFWKLQKTDLRDTEALVRTFGVPEMQRAGVSQTQTVIVGPQDHMIRFSPEDGRPSLTIMPVPAQGSKQIPLRTGVISAGARSRQPAPALSEAQWHGRPVVKVVISRPPSTSTYIADPAIGYRFRQVTVTDADARVLREIIASDYREVDGVPCPFRWEDRVFGPGSDQPLSEEIITVEAASFEAPAGDPFSLRVPAGTEICNLVGPLRGFFTLGTARTIDLETAPRLTPYGGGKP